MEQLPERPSPSSLFGPGFRVMLLITLFFSCGGIHLLLTNIPGLEYLLGTGDEITVREMRIANAVNTILMFIVPALVIANIFPSNRFYWFRLHNRPVTWWPIAAVIIMIAMVFVANPIAEWIATTIKDPEIIKGEAENAEYSKYIQYMPSLGDFLASLTVLALLPAIAEELFFRATLLQLMADWLKNKHVAILFSALVFAFLHATIAGLPAIFICGVILGYLFVWTGSLRVSIAGHFFFNAFEVTDSYLNQLYPQSWWANWHPGTIVIATAVLVVGAGLFAVFKNTRNHPYQML